MTQREDHGWHADRPCPDWCQSTDHHLGERLHHRTDHFWHKGSPESVPTEDETPNREPITAEVYLSQHVVVDERVQHPPSGGLRRLRRHVLPGQRPPARRHPRGPRE